MKEKEKERERERERVKFVESPFFCDFIAT